MPPAIPMGYAPYDKGFNQSLLIPILLVPKPPGGQIRSSEATGELRSFILKLVPVATIPWMIVTQF